MQETRDSRAWVRASIPPAAVRALPPGMREKVMQLQKARDAAQAAAQQMQKKGMELQAWGVPSNISVDQEKYMRYARRISKIAAHNPDEIGAHIGDLVEIAECRKISKTKAWIVTKIVVKGHGRLDPGQVKAHDEAQRHMKEKKEETQA